MSLNTPMLNSDSVSPLVLGEPMDGGTGSSLGWVAVRCLYLSQAYAWASCGPLQVTHWLSFVSGGIVPHTLDPALLRPGRLDRKVEFGFPDLESRMQIFKIHTRTMNCERDIRFELLARLCPNSTVPTFF
ncbi:hypothetical protein JHK82_022367 [Glycine max]|nr:hypothetical protein JHK86_022385 [Glycine max]KAG5137636.1 hypothetical protein JHK82_022367 [Glycine max]